MIIKMKSLAAGPDGVMASGKEYNLDDNVAQALIDGGYAELVGGQDAPIDDAPESKKGKGK